MRPTDRFENWFITSLQTGINDTTGSFRLNDNLNVSQARLVIDPYDESVREVVKVTSVDGNLVYVERGDDNTQPHYHLEGAIVALNVVAADMNDLYADWAEADATLTTLAEDAQEVVDGAAATQADAIAATQAANTAASSASSAASTASTAANAANSAASSASSAANSATNAATDANNAAGSANTAAQDAVDAAEAALNAAGHFVPAGGLATQALVKASDSDYDLEWGEGGGGASVTVSDTPPADAEPGDLWGDTSDDGLASLIIAVGNANYPVGSTYFNKTDSTNPATLLGFGTWARLEGVVLGGRSETGGSPFNVAAGTIIGEDEHTMTIAEMARHRHGGSTGGTIITATAAAQTGTGTSPRPFAQGTGAWISGVELNGSNHSHSISYEGNGTPFNVIQRTLVGYLWERIS